MKASVFAASIVSASIIIASAAACDSSTYPGTTASGQLTSVGIGMTGPFDGDGGLSVGATYQMLATARYQNGPGQNVSNQSVWVSSNPNVASIAQDGTLKALALGTSTVTVTFQGVSGS